jgi:hypothetical protein
MTDKDIADPVDYYAHLQEELDQLARDNPEVAAAALRVDDAINRLVDNIHVVHRQGRTATSAPRIDCGKSCPGLEPHLHCFLPAAVQPTAAETAAYRAQHDADVAAGEALRGKDPNA